MAGQRSGNKAFEKRALAARAAAVVGVDAGKFHHLLVVRVRGRSDSKPLKFATTRVGFETAVRFVDEQLQMLQARPASGSAVPDDAPILVGIEFAGSYGFTFAHYLRGLSPRYHVVSVLPAHTKRWKEVMHRQPLKTDAKDAIGICDLAAQGHFVSFPYFTPVYAELRYLLSARERLSTLRRGVVTRLRACLDVVFPEFTTVLKDPTKKTARALLRTYPGPAALLAAPRRRLDALAAEASGRKVKAPVLDRLLEAASTSVAVPSAKGAVAEEIPLLIDRYVLYSEQLAVIEARMAAHVDSLPAGRALLTVPNIGPVSAATFLGSIGDPTAYDSSRQIVALAGLTLVERSSGMHQGERRISKRGRPTLRRHAHIFAVRSVQQGGIFRKPYEALLARNGGRAFPALTAIARAGLKLLFSVARDGHTWTPEPPASGSSGARATEA